MCLHSWSLVSVHPAALSYLDAAYTTGHGVQLNRCPSLTRFVYHSQGGGDVQYAQWENTSNVITSSPIL